MGRIATQNAELWCAANDNNSDYFEQVARYERYARTIPYTDKQLKQIRTRGLEPGFLQTIAPIVETLVGMFASNKSMPTAIPLGDNTGLAFLAQVLLTEFFRKNMWSVLQTQVYTDTLITGRGWAMIDIDDGTTNNNPFGCQLRYMPYRKVRWSSNYTHPLMDDADYLCVYDMMSVKAALIRSGKPYDEKMQYVSEIWNWPSVLQDRKYFGDYWREQSGRNENSIVPWIETYWKDYKNYVKLIQLDKDKNKIVRSFKVPIKNESDGLYQNTMSYFYDIADGDGEKAKTTMNEFMKLGKLEPLKLQRVIKSVSVGGYDIGEYELPTNKYPIVNFDFNVFEQGNPVGIVERIYGTQALINQSLMISVDNGRLTNSFRMMFPNGSVDDPNVAMQRLSKHGGHISYEAQTFGSNQVVEPKPLVTPPLSNHFFELIDRLLLWQQNATSVNEAMQGQYQGSTPPAGAAVRAMQETAGMKFQPYANKMQASICRLASVAWDYIREYSKYDVIVRMMDEDDELVERITIPNAGLDTVGALRELNTKPEAIGMRTDFPTYNMEVPVNYRIQDGDTVHYINDLKNTEDGVEIVITTAAATDTAKQRWGDVMFDFIHQHPDKGEVILPIILKMLGFPQARKIAQKLDIVARVTGENEQLKAVNQQLVKQAKLLSEQNFRAKTNEEKTKEMGKYKSAFETLRNDMQSILKNNKGENVNTAEVAEAVKILDGVIDQLFINDAPGSQITEETINEMIPKTVLPQ